MITLVKEGERQVTNCMEFVCRSTDVKPVGQYNGLVIPNGSTLKEIDTDANFVYDKSIKSWIGKRVQPDWSQNDPSAADYIRNRPMYKETKIKTFDLSENEFYNSKLPGFDLPAVGKKVIVNVDGSDVEYAVKSWAGMGEEVLYIGDNPEGVLSGEAENTWCIFEYEGLCACKSNSILRLPIVETIKIPNDYLDTTIVALDSFQDDNVEQDVLDNIKITIPVSRHFSSTDMSVSSTYEGRLVVKQNKPIEQRIEITSTTLDSKTFEITYDYKYTEILLLILDFDTKTMSYVSLPIPGKFDTIVSGKLFENTYSQTVAYINDILFAFKTSVAVNNSNTLTLTIKRIRPEVSS